MPSYLFLKSKTVNRQMSQVAHQAGAYPGCCSMKRLGVFLPHTGWDTSYLQH